MSFTFLDGQTRRSFLVSIAGSIIGTFFLPRLPGPGGAPAAEEASDAVADDSQSPPMRHLLSPPRRRYLAEPKNGIDFCLLWTELTDDGPKPMIWIPKTAEEVADAMHLYIATRPEPLVVEGPVISRSPEEKALIQAIMDEPGNSNHRVAYADWLTAHGDSRGEFMRLTDILETDPRFKQFEAHWVELEKENYERYEKPLLQLGFYELYRGGKSPTFIYNPLTWVVDELRLTRNDILPEHAERVFGIAPFVQKLDFDCSDLDIPLDVVGVAALPQLEQLTFLRLRGLTLDDVAIVVNSPHLKRLRYLHLACHGLGSELSRVLLQSPWFGQLRGLSLDICGLGDDGLQSLLSGLKPGQLEYLHLAQNGITDAGMETLAAATGLSRITALTLNSNAFTAAGIRPLARAAFAANLAKLDLSQCSLDASAAAALAAVPLSALRELDLSSNRLQVKGAQALAKASWIGGLQVLRLDHNEIAESGAQSLFGSPRFTHLAELGLTGNRIGPKGIAAFATNAPGSLTTLRLNDNFVDNEGARALATAASLTNLEVLQLDHNKLGPAGAAALAQSPHLQRLKRLCVSAADVGPRGKAALLNRFGDRVVQFYG